MEKDFGRLLGLMAVCATMLLGFLPLSLHTAIETQLSASCVFR